MKTSQWFLLLFLVSIFSCSNSDTKNTETPPSTHTLKKVAEYEIEIDSVTANNFIHYQHYTENDKEYFTFLNRVTQEINFYDLDDKSLAFKVTLPTQGPNRVGTLEGFNSGYHIHNLDSIFVINRVAQRLFVMNQHSQKVGEIEFAREGYSPTPILAPFAPMKVIDNYAYFLNIQGNINYMSKNKRYNSDYATVIDLENSQKDFFLSYPEVYTKGAWGLELHRISWAINSNNHLIVSYPLDEHLYELDLNGNIINQHKASASKVSKARSIKRSEKSRREVRAYYASQGKYGQVFFDSVRNLYLRDAFSPVPKSAALEGLIHNYERPVVILDQNFKKIGEFDEPSKSPLVLFFNEQGIHKCIQGLNEDLLKFEVYELATI